MRKQICIPSVTGYSVKVYRFASTPFMSSDIIIDHIRALKTIERYFYQLLWLTAKKLVYDWEQAENLEKILFLISQFLMICRSLEFNV